LRFEWHSPAMFAPGDADLDLAAQILGGGKSSRLYKATGVRAAHRPGRLGLPKLADAGELCSDSA
jgi:hypothetical protein